MFINTGGLPEGHNPLRGRKRNLQRHHHGHRHLQQSGQHHHLYRSRRLAACRHPLLSDSRHHGSLFPAALLLKPGSPPPTFSLPPHSSPPIPLSPPSPASTTLHCTDHKTNMDGLRKPSLSS